MGNFQGITFVWFRTNREIFKSALLCLQDNINSYSFQDTISPSCNCGQDIESPTHLFLHFPLFINERRTLLSTIRSLESKLLHCNDYDLTHTLFFGNTSQTSSNIFNTINASIDYILSSKRFDEKHFLNEFLISKLEFSQQFSLFICYYYDFIYFIYWFIYFSYLILPGAFQYPIYWLGDRVRFSSSITQNTYKFNHKLNCDDKCLIYLLTCKQYVGETKDAFHKRWNNYKNNARKFLRGESCMQEHLLEHFQSPGQPYFVKDVCITFIDKTNVKITGDNH